MIKYIKSSLLIIFLFFISCIDVVDIEVPTSPPRLVIEASLDWQKYTRGNVQSIKLSTSTPFFDTAINNVVTGAMVKVTNNNNQREVIFEDQNNGDYTTSNFVPVLNQSYTLEILYKGETYIAKESLTSVVEIFEILQTIKNGHNPKALEVNIKFKDPVDEDNYYLSKFQERSELLPTLIEVDDEFTNGNVMTITYEKFNNENTNDEEFLPGDIVDIYLHGVSEQYYDYIRLLIEQAGSAGEIFSTIPAAIKGNCVNISNPDNYAFGYFRLTEVDKTIYIFE